jgi:hypothetical protein
VAQTPPNASRIPHPSSSDALIAVLLFAGLAALFALTRSHWLDDWDSVNFAFALDDFDVMRHRPHPPGYPLYVAAGKLAYLAIANHAAALTLVSSLSGAAVALMFYFLDRRQNNWPVALCATLVMALSPLSSLASRSPTCSAWCSCLPSCWSRAPRHRGSEATSQYALPAASSPDWRSVPGRILPF